MLFQNLKDLTGLEFFNCKFISDEVIHLLRPKENGSGISYLGLTGCSGVRKEILLDEASKFRFSNLIIKENYVAFHPRETEVELRKEAQTAYERRIASTDIQRVVRGGLIRCGIIRRKRQERAGKHSIDWAHFNRDLRLIKPLIGHFLVYTSFHRHTEVARSHPRSKTTNLDNKTSTR